jgi:hypothetical protein
VAWPGFQTSNFLYWRKESRASPLDYMMHVRQWNMPISHPSSYAHIMISINIHSVFSGRFYKMQFSYQFFYKATWKCFVS